MNDRVLTTAEGRIHAALSVGWPRRGGVVHLSKQWHFVRPAMDHLRQLQLANLFTRIWVLADHDRAYAPLLAQAERLLWYWAEEGLIGAELRGHLIPAVRQESAQMPLPELARAVAASIQSQVMQFHRHGRRREAHELGALVLPERRDPSAPGATSHPHLP